MGTPDGGAYTTAEERRLEAAPRGLALPEHAAPQIFQKIPAFLDCVIRRCSKKIRILFSRFLFRIIMNTGRMGRELFSGVCMVKYKGDTIFSRAYGFANRAFKIPNKLDTKYDTASICC